MGLVALAVLVGGRGERLSEGNAERGTIAALVALGGLVRRRGEARGEPITLALAFGNKIALTADHVSIEATCASALPTRSRSSWEPMPLAQRLRKGSGKGKGVNNGKGWRGKS